MEQLQIKRCNIELTNRCNMRCRMCGDKHEREFVDMKIEEFRSIVDGVVESSAFHKKELPEFRLFLSGEPTLYPQLQQAILYLCQKKAKSILIHTNGLMAGRLCFLYPLSEYLDDMKLTIVFSLDGEDSHDWAQLKGCPEYMYDKVLKNISLLHELEIENLEIKIQCCLSRQKLPKMAEVRKSISVEAGVSEEIVTVRPMHNWDEADSILGATVLNYGLRCDFMYHDLVIYSNGLVGLCCADLNARTTFGHIGCRFNYNAYAAFNTIRRKIMRENMKQKNSFMPCSGCERYGIK